MGIPDVLPVHHALWLTLFIVPLVALSMLFAPDDPDDMTDARTPVKRVAYPDTFVAPDKANPYGERDDVIDPPVEASRSGGPDYASVVRCLAYNDASTHLSGHPDELLIGWPSNDIRVRPANRAVLSQPFKQRLGLALAAVLPASMCCIVTYCVALADSRFLSAFEWGVLPPLVPSPPSHQAYRAVVRAQGVTMLSFVLWLVALSGHALQRGQPFTRYNPARCVGWLLTSLTAVAAQVCYGIVHTAIVATPVIYEPAEHNGHSAFSWYVWVIALLWPVVYCAWLSLLKHRELREFAQTMRRARLQFTTRLGRYSPR